LNTAIAFCWAVDPSAVSTFFPAQLTVPAGPGRVVAEALGRLSSLPQAVSALAAVVVANAAAPNALLTLSSLTRCRFLDAFWTYTGEQ